MTTEELTEAVAALTARQAITEQTIAELRGRLIDGIATKLDAAACLELFTSFELRLMGEIQTAHAAVDALST